jgi:hypothetical protein
MQKTGERMDNFGDKFINTLNTFGGNKSVDSNTVKNEGKT